jgi:hypothetical protein
LIALQSLNLTLSFLFNSELLAEMGPAPDGITVDSIMSHWVDEFGPDVLEKQLIDAAADGDADEVLLSGCYPADPDPLFRPALLLRFRRYTPYSIAPSPLFAVSPPPRCRATTSAD